jgi:thymidylate synthase (FAD)
LDKTKKNKKQRQNTKIFLCNPHPKFDFCQRYNLNTITIKIDRMAKFISDGIGSVELLETFGSDLTVVNAARVSFAKESTEMCLADEKLINYLAKNDHITPFFHPQIRFRIKMPIFVAREWFRHQIGLARNEVSRRYVDFEPECWLPVDGLRARDPKLKQGSKSEVIEDNELWQVRIADFTKDAVKFYKDLLAAQVAPELARTVLPQSMYTEFIETGSLSAYARICGLRLDPHAQKEIREYAALLSEQMEKAFPVSWKALTQRWSPAPAPAETNTIVQQEPQAISIGVSLPATEPIMTINPVTLKTKEDNQPCYTQWGC